MTRGRTGRLAVAGFDDVRREAGVPAGVPLFVCVGELNRNKRQADAVEALAAMQTRQAYLLLIGEGRQRADIDALPGAGTSPIEFD